MTEVTDPAILALLAEARRQFASGLPAKVAELDGLLSRGAWDELRRAAHKLRGSAGTYGFVELSASAAAIEEALLAASLSPSDDVRAELAAHLLAAAASAELAAGGRTP